MKQRRISMGDEKTKSDENADSIADGIEIMLEANKRQTLHLKPRGAFSRMLDDAQIKIDSDQPRGKFGRK